MDLETVRAVTTHSEFDLTGCQNVLYLLRSRCVFYILGVYTTF